MFYIYSIIVINHYVSPITILRPEIYSKRSYNYYTTKSKTKGIHFVNFETLKLPKVFLENRNLRRKVGLTNSRETLIFRTLNDQISNFPDLILH